MATIEVDFEVFKALTVRRATEDVSYNDVVRELLGLPSTMAILMENAIDPAAEAEGWNYKGVHFPAGTQFRVNYKGKVYTAKIWRGVFDLDGNRMNSPSEAATAITGNNVNGWRFWECKLPGQTQWRRLDSLR